MEKLISKLDEIKKKLILPENSFTRNFDKDIFKGILDRLSALVKRKFGTDSEYLSRFEQIRNNSYSVYESDLEQLKNLIDIIIDDIELDSKKEEDVAKPIRLEYEAQTIAKKIDSLNNKIFIVHGHNETMKQSVARVIEKLELEPIILHEQTNQGNTIIEKFVRNSNVGFAIVLLSADDLGYAKIDGENKLKKRARQNVVLELGFFIGKLGRNNVIALVEDMDDLELPSDIDGVVYISYNSSNSWKFDIVKELTANGYNLDANKIL